MNRKPAVAGSFYPANHKELSGELEQLFASAFPKMLKNVGAIISPHAGYLFSGGVAASAFNQIEREKEYERVFIIASSHRSSFAGASIYCHGNFDMPYGQEPVDTQLGKFLCNEFPTLFSSNPLHHSKEHSIEVQLPFIKFTLKPTYKIVPILLGDVSPQECLDIAQILKSYFNSENLFIISSDFSHYPSYDTARSVDQATMEAIVSNNPENLLKVLKDNSNQGIKKLSTSLCGWSAVMVLLYLTQQEPFYSYHAVEYKNSGDNTLYGDLESVVGYWAIAITRDSEVLHWIARRSIEKAITEENPIYSNEKAWAHSAEKTWALSNDNNSALSNNENSALPNKKPSANLKAQLLIELGMKEIPPSLKMECGVFVTLKKRGKLRGCVGYMQSNTPLYKEVANVAVLAACYDNRFNKVTPKELEEIEIEISVLSPMQLIKDINEIEMGVHGIQVQKGDRSGVFLPQVGAETKWSREEFLGHCARDKAGLGWDGWKDAQISIFTVTII